MIANCHSSSVHDVGKVCLDAHCFRLFSVPYKIDKVAIKLGCIGVIFPQISFEYSITYLQQQED